MSERAARQQHTDALTDAIEAEFDAIESAIVDDATPDTWRSVALGINVRAESTMKYGDLYQKTGYEIPANLQSLAPRLYRFIRNYEDVLDMDVRMRPERVTDHDNLYDGNLYLIDITLA